MERRQRNYTPLKNWLRLYPRHYLATGLLGYGFAKFFPSQFQEMMASRLMMEVGEQPERKGSGPARPLIYFTSYSTIFSKIFPDCLFFKISFFAP